MIIVAQARAFAIGAHSAVRQLRKYTGEPYWHHPRAVAELVQIATGSQAATADPRLLARAQSKLRAYEAGTTLPCPH